MVENMKAYIVKSLIGFFAIDENGKIIDYVLFEKNPREIAEKILEEGITDEEKKLIDLLKKRGYRQFISSKRNDCYKFEPENFGEKVFRKKFREFTRKLNFSDEELNSFLTRIGLELTREKIRKSIRKDRILIQVVNAIDELDKSLNILITRLREWYGLHFPEMSRIIENHEKFAKLVSRYGLRSHIEEERLKDLKEKSIGIELDEKDERILKEYATRIEEMYKLREHLEKYVDHLMSEIAPNTKELAGSLIGARLIALAGGLEKLAQKPSSTVQLLGAEKALFRYLRGRGRSPKFGVLFIHPLVQKTPREKKGKVARVIASKISIAAKLDFYGRKEKTEKLKEDLEEKIKKIMVD